MSNFSVYKGKIQTAISPRFLAQISCNRPSWKAYEVIFHVPQVTGNLELPFWRYGANCGAYANWDSFYSIWKRAPFDLLPNDLIYNSLYFLKEDILRVPKSIFGASHIHFKLE